MKTAALALGCVFALIAGNAAGVQFNPPDKKINSNPAGTSYSGGNFTCDNNGNVYAFYNDSRNHPVDPTMEINALEVYFNISTNQGLSWATDKLIGGPGPNGDSAHGIRKWGRFLGCDENGLFYCGWMDGRNFFDPARPYHCPSYCWWEDGILAATTNYGATWPPETRLNTWDGYSPRCAMPMSANDQNGNIYVTWYSTIEQMTNVNVIRFRRSTDFGATWETEIRLDHAPANAYEEGPVVKCDENGHVYTVWYSYHRSNVFFNCSADHGQTWLPGDLPVARDLTSDHQKGYPSLAADQNGNVYAAWSDWRDGPNDWRGPIRTIYFNRSTDFGATWGASDIRLDSMGPSPKAGPEYGAQLACTDDGTVYAVWEDKRNGGEWDIFFTRSTDHGATWETDRRLDTDNPGAFSSFRPSLACDASNGVYVVWEDWREGYHHIYMNYSSDRGATWQASDLRVDTDTNAAHAEWPTLRADRKGTVYVGWGYHRISWAGEVADFHFNVSLSADLTAPVLPELPPGGDLGINPDPLPVCVDDLIAIDDVDGEVPVICSAGEVTGDDCNKSQVFTYSATDAASNTASDIVTYTWQVDVTAPVLPELPAGGDLGINPDPLPACVDGLLATDNCDGEVPVICSAGEVTGDDCNQSQVFTYSATDAASNTASDTVTYTWQVDVTAPVLPALPAGGDLGINPDPLPACVDGLLATDNCDGEVPVICSAGEVTGDDGNKSQVFTYTATDAASNTVSDIATYTWKEVLIQITAEEILGGTTCLLQSVGYFENGNSLFLDACTNLLSPQDWRCIQTNVTPLPRPATNLWQFDLPNEEDRQFFRVRQWL